MPTYDLKCAGCRHKFEDVLPLSAGREGHECPRCKRRLAAVQFSPTSNFLVPEEFARMTPKVEKMLAGNKKYLEGASDETMSRQVFPKGRDKRFDPVRPKKVF